MTQVKPSTAAPKRSWLYPISETGEKFFVLNDGTEYPVSIDTYKMLVEDGRLSQDEKWSLHINFLQVRPKDEVFIYTGDQNLGIIGYARVKEVFPDDRALVLNFDIQRCKDLLLKPVSAKIVRKWISSPRAAMYDLSPYRTSLNKRLPWNQPQNTDKDVLATQLPIISAGFGSAEMNRKIEKAAVKRVRKMYRSKGWKVTSVEHEKLGFDLFCKKGTKVRQAEVKGVKGCKVGFLITSGEFRKASEDGRFVLHVVIEALSKDAQVHTWSGKQMLRDFNFAPIQYVPQLKPEKRDAVKL